MNAVAHLTAFALVSIALAGCLDDTGTGLDTPLDTTESAEAMPVALSAQGCIQGGGNSVYNGQTNVGPWPSADQRPRLGNPTIGAYGQPLTGPAYGIWHVAVVCDSYTHDGETVPGFTMGWVAQMIEQPDFDTSDADYHFFVADLSFSVTDFNHQLKDAAGEGVEVNENFADATQVTATPGEAYLWATLGEAGHGTFDWTGEITKDLGAKETEHFRFWLLVAMSGCGHSHGLECAEGDDAEEMYYPVAIDVYDTATGGGIRKAGESVGTFTHLPDGHYGNPASHLETGFDRDIVMGPVFMDVTYDTTWLH